MLLYLPAPALAEDDGPGEIKSRFYGHFSPALISFADGVERYSEVADNAFSGGRVGVWIDFVERFGTFKFNFEASLGTRTSASISQTYLPPLIDLDNSTLRKAEAIIETERYGSFSLGQGSMGSDGVTKSDLSGTQLAAYVGIADTAGGFSFRTRAGALSPVTLADAFPAYDGGRAPRLRWDSPDLALDGFGTFNVALSAGPEVFDGNLALNEALADSGLFYRNRLGSFDVKASAGASLVEVNGSLVPQTSGSVSLRHADSGWSVTLAAGAREGEGQYIYSKIGLKRRWFDWGETALSVDLYEGTNTVSAESRSESVGVGIVQDLDRQNLQFYLGWRRYDFDQTGVLSYRTSSSIFFGTRWVFKKLDAVHFARGRREQDWSAED